MIHSQTGLLYFSCKHDFQIKLATRLLKIVKTVILLWTGLYSKEWVVYKLDITLSLNNFDSGLFLTQNIAWYIYNIYKKEFIKLLINKNSNSVRNRLKFLEVFTDIYLQCITKSVSKLNQFNLSMNHLEIFWEPDQLEKIWL